jgi:ribose transport system ATP-binding protein
MSELLEMREITKSFPGVVALNNVDFNVCRGEIMGLLGENGAGKSTLVKIIGGIYKPDNGVIKFDGKRVELQNPHHSENLGVSIIHQEHNLFPNLTVADNIFLGKEKTRLRYVIDAVSSNNAASVLLKKVGLKVKPDLLITDLSVSQRQMVEVAKALSINAKILVMDEPTSSLTAAEAEILFEIIKSLTREGVAVVYISHKMEEVFRLCDRIKILRDGKDIGVFQKHAISEKDVINLMVGREIESMFERKDHTIGEEVLRVESLSTRTGVKNVSFKVHAGEVLGFAGLVGAGRSELMRAIFGVDEITEGRVFLNRKLVSIKSPRDAIHLGIGFVPEDRKEQGLILGMSVNENISLANLDNLKRFFILDEKRESDVTIHYMKSLRIKAVNKNQIVSSLSGGNQQKVVLGKWLSIEPQILILDEPTRGIDVGAKREIYHLINELSNRGVAILLISSELIEIIAMSDRILVMHEGQGKGEISSEEADQEKIMNMAIATTKEEVCLKK